ncbi:hypothetical protein BGZ96_012553, partial [Linnemannia gamsii]
RHPQNHGRKTHTNHNHQTLLHYHKNSNNKTPRLFHHKNSNSNNNTPLFHHKNSNHNNYTLPFHYNNSSNYKINSSSNSNHGYTKNKYKNRFRSITLSTDQ